MDYKGKDEGTLRQLLDACPDFEERRKIRAAIRDVRLLDSPTLTTSCVQRSSSVKLNTGNGTAVPPRKRRDIASLAMGVRRASSMKTVPQHSTDMERVNDRGNDRNGNVNGSQDRGLNHTMSLKYNLTGSNNTITRTNGIAGSNNIKSGIVSGSHVNATNGLIKTQGANTNNTSNTNKNGAQHVSTANFNLSSTTGAPPTTTSSHPPRVPQRSSSFNVVRSKPYSDVRDANRDDAAKMLARLIPKQPVVVERKEVTAAGGANGGIVNGRQRDIEDLRKQLLQSNNMEERLELRAALVKMENNEKNSSGHTATNATSSSTRDSNTGNPGLAAKKPPVISGGHLGSFLLSRQDPPKPGVILKTTPIETESNPFKAYLQEEIEVIIPKSPKSEKDGIVSGVGSSIRSSVGSSVGSSVSSVGSSVGSVSRDSGISSFRNVSGPPKTNSDSIDQSVPTATSDFSPAFKYSAVPSQDVEITKPSAAKLTRNPAIKVNRSSTFCSPLNRRPSAESIRLIPGLRRSDSRETKETRDDIKRVEGETRDDVKRVETREDVKIVETREEVKRAETKDNVRRVETRENKTVETSDVKIEDTGKINTEQQLKDKDIERTENATDTAMFNAPVQNEEKNQFRDALANRRKKQQTEELVQSQPLSTKSNSTTSLFIPTALPQTTKNDNDQDNNTERRPSATNLRRSNSSVRIETLKDEFLRSSGVASTDKMAAPGSSGVKRSSSFNACLSKFSNMESKQGKDNSAPLWGQRRVVVRTGSMKNPGRDRDSDRYNTTVGDSFITRQRGVRDNTEPKTVVKSMEYKESTDTDRNNITKDSDNASIRKSTDKVDITFDSKKATDNAESKLNTEKTDSRNSVKSSVEKPVSTTLTRTDSKKLNPWNSARRSPPVESPPNGASSGALCSGTVKGGGERNEDVMLEEKPPTSATEKLYVSTDFDERKDIRAEMREIRKDMRNSGPSSSSPSKTSGYSSSSLSPKKTFLSSSSPSPTLSSSSSVFATPPSQLSPQHPATSPADASTTTTSKTVFISPTKNGSTKSTSSIELNQLVSLTVGLSSKSEPELKMTEPQPVAPPRQKRGRSPSPKLEVGLTQLKHEGIEGALATQGSEPSHLRSSSTTRESTSASSSGVSTATASSSSPKETLNSSQSSPSSSPASKQSPSTSPPPCASSTSTTSSKTQLQSLVSIDESAPSQYSVERAVTLEDGSRQHIKTNYRKTQTPSVDEYEEETVVKTEYNTNSDDDDDKDDKDKNSKHHHQRYETTETVKTKHKVKKTGSNYYQRDAYLTTKLRDVTGRDYETTDIVSVTDSLSATKGKHQTETVETTIIKDDGSGKEPVVMLEAEQVDLGGSSSETSSESSSSEESTESSSESEESESVESECSAVDADEENSDKEAETEEFEPPEVIDPLLDTAVIDGDPLILTCRVQVPPKPAAKVSWYSGEKLLAPGGDFQQTFCNGIATLAIGEVFPDDEGEYRCVIKCGGSDAETRAQVTIKENSNLQVPRFTVSLKDTTAAEGVRVILQCQVTGTPPPTVQWFQNNLLLRNNSDFKQSQNGVVAKLVITDPYKDDSGIYACIAKSVAGEAKTSCNVTVKDPKEVKGAAPVFRTSLLNIMAKEGDQIMYEAHLAPGVSPTPTVTWTRDGTVIPCTPAYTQTFDDAENRGKALVARLVIVSAVCADAGLIKCTALNALGETSTSAKLTVKATAPAPAFAKPLTDLVVQDGRRACLQCSIGGAENDANVVWFKNGKVARPGVGFEQTFDGKSAKFVISQVFPDDDGEYECRVKTDDYEMWTKCRLTVTENAPSLVQQHTSKFSSPFKPPMGGGTPGAGGLRNGLGRHAKAAAGGFSLQKFLSERIHEEKSHPTPPTTTTHTPNMPDLDDIDSIEDEDLLHKMLGETEEFEDRRKIRARLREIREQRTGVLLAKKERGPQVPAMAESNEEAVFRSTKTEKAEGGGHTTTTTTTTKQTSKDGTTTTVKQSKNITQTGGPGSTNVVITKTSAGKTSSRGALAAFQQMDNANNPGGGKPNSPGGLSPTSPTTPGGGRVAVQRSPSAIKQMLLEWCKRITQGYEHVNITNFSSSWNDGMAFCAMMHHFYPRAFDYAKLNPKCRRGNFKLAFDVAEKLGGVAPLLDVDDMVKMKNPDWKCVFTYVQSLYRRFREDPNNAQKKEAAEKEEENNDD